MSKCRYDLSEDCNSKDCLDCVLDKIKAEIEFLANSMAEYTGMVCAEDVCAIIDKYRK